MAVSRSPDRVVSPERVVLLWVEAFNARDLGGMLSRLSPEVDFHPLRLSGIEARYRGHDGVRCWFAQLQHQHHRHRIEPSEVQCLGEERVFTVGSLAMDGDPAIGPFCALHRVREGLVVSAHHYLTDADMIERLGLLR